jgi:hypothetical protein
MNDREKSDGRGYFRSSRKILVIVGFLAGGGAWGCVQTGVIVGCGR